MKVNILFDIFYDALVLEFTIFTIALSFHGFFVRHNLNLTASVIEMSNPIL